MWCGPPRPAAAPGELAVLVKAENALLDALRTHRDVPRLVRTIASLPQVADRDLLSRYVADAPALYVVPGQFNARDDSMVLVFTVVAFVRNAAGQELARKGDGLRVGLDQLLVLATRAINGRALGGCNWRLTKGTVVDEPAFFSNGITALEMTFESSPIELDVDYGEEQLDELDNLTLVHADFDLAPMASIVTRSMWTREPADYSTDRPNLQADIQLNGGS